jgi:hypothetical protein
MDGTALTLRANLGAEPYEGDLPALEGEVFLSLGDASDQRRLEPWSVAFSIGKKTTQ